MSEPLLTYLEHPSQPSLQLPALACDAHVHVFGPAERFAFAASRNFTPVDAPRERLFGTWNESTSISDSTWQERC